MGERYLYLIDEDAPGTKRKVIRRWSVDGMTETEIENLEKSIRPLCSEGVVLRDSAFD